MDTTRLERVSTGSQGPILIVDFVRLDARPTLTTLLQRELNADIFRLDPVTDMAVDGTVPPLAVMAGTYIDRIEAGMPPPAVVVGFCNASTLAVMLSRGLGHANGGTPCVLVDPSWPTSAAIEQNLGEMRQTLRPGAADTARIEPGDDAYLERCIDIIRRDLMDVMADDDVPEEEASLAVESLLPRYRAWLGFLIETFAAPVTPLIGEDVTVLSATPTHSPTWRWVGLADDGTGRDPLAVGSPGSKMIIDEIQATFSRTTSGGQQ